MNVFDWMNVYDSMNSLFLPIAQSFHATGVASGSLHAMVVLATNWDVGDENVDAVKPMMRLSNELVAGV
jgi:hypothetical protein